MRNELERASQEHGFSLLELIVALTILSFMTVALASALRVGITAWSRVAGTEDTQSDLYFSQNAIRRFVEMARPIAVDEAQPERGLEFSGQSDRLRFVSPMPAAFGLGGDYVIEFAIRTRASGQKDLVFLPHVYAGPEGSSGLDIAANNETTVVPNIASVSWTYFGSNTAREEPSWTKTWESRLLLPQLVALEVAFPSGVNRTWPQLLVAPKLR